jgi:hypothetical protein
MFEAKHHGAVAFHAMLTKKFAGGPCYGRRRGRPLEDRGVNWRLIVGQGRKLLLSQIRGERSQRARKRDYLQQQLDTNPSANIVFDDACLWEHDP